MLKAASHAKLALAGAALLAVFFVNFLVIHFNVQEHSVDPLARVSTLRGAYRIVPVNYTALDALRSQHAGHWSPHPDGTSYMFTPAAAQHSLASARKCLAGKHVLLIGDSITRYMFLSLVIWLQTGEWAPRMAQDSQHPSPLFEGDFGSWFDLFKSCEAYVGDSVRCVGRVTRHLLAQSRWI